MREPALEERATASAVLTIGGVSAAIMGASHLAGYDIPIELSVALLITVLVVMSVPQLIWFASYRLGRFK